MAFGLKKQDKNDIEDQRINALKNFDLFKGLKKKDLKYINQLLLVRKYKAGELIYRKGYPHTVLYFVSEGDVCIYLEKDGEELVLLHKMPNEHFGEIGLFIEMDRTASARAEKPTTLLALSKKDFAKLMNSYPKLSNIILNNITSYLCKMLINNNAIITRLNDQINEIKAK